MGQAIGQVLTFGVGVSLSPIPIIGVVLMLATPRARSNGPRLPRRLDRWARGRGGGRPARLGRRGSVGRRCCPAGLGQRPEAGAGCVLLLGGRACGSGAVVPGPGPRPRCRPGCRRSTADRPPKCGGARRPRLSAVNPKNLLLVVGAAAAIAQTGARQAHRRRRWRSSSPSRRSAPARPGRDLLRPRRAIEGHPRRPAGLDVPEQRDDHGGDLPGHRGEADRRRDLRLLLPGPTHKGPT